MQDKQQVIDMLMYLKGTGNVEISKNANQVINFNEWFWQEQIYFVAGMDNKPTKRTVNSDFTKKRYIFIDIDVRNDYLNKYGKILSDEELELEIGKIKEVLDTNSFDYQILVHSGNGIHIYFCWWEEEFTADEYSHGVSYFIQVLDPFLAPLWYRVDAACKNISRLSRLPWSINTRNKVGKYNMWPASVDILYMNLETESMYFAFLKSFADKYEDQQNKIREARNAFVMQPDINGDGDIWAEINRIPLTNIIWHIWNVEVLDRWWDNVAISEWHKNMWAYWYKPNNILINTWSSMITHQEKSYFTMYELVLLEKFAWDKKATVDFFKDKFNISPKAIAVKKVETAIKKVEPVQDAWLIAYMYPSPFEDFVCLLSWEYAVISAATNSGKTSFVHNVMNRQITDWHSCFYINLEFTVADIAKKKWLDINGKNKADLSENMSTLTEEEKQSLHDFVKSYLARFDYIDKPNGIWCKEFMEILMNTIDSWYIFIVIDTIDKIENDVWKWFADYDMFLGSTLQKICQDYNVCIIGIKHTNKAWVIGGTYSVQTQAKHIVFIDRDTENNDTTFKLLKDKSTGYKEIICVWEKWEFVKTEY